jgi:hypothetical protein
MTILRKITIAIALFCIFGVSSVFAKPIPDTISGLHEHKVINVVDDLLAFWDQSRGLSLRRQRRAWTRLVETKHRDSFEKAIYRGADESQRRVILDQFLLRLAWQIGAIREFNKTAPELVERGLLDFKSRFPEYSQERDIYIAPSMFMFDGSVRPVQNEEGVPDTLCLGGDVLSGYTAEQFQMVIAHELFHLYHFGFLMRDASPAEFRTGHLPLIIEGMAVAGTEMIYPYLPASSYLHFSDDELAAQEVDLMFSSRRFLTLLSDGSPSEQYESWFTNTADPTVPPRGGYLLGYEVAKRVLATYTMEQMVRLTPAQLREHVEEQLLEMSTDQIILLASGN